MPEPGSLGDDLRENPSKAFADEGYAEVDGESAVVDMICEAAKVAIRAGRTVKETELNVPFFMTTER